MAAYLYFVDPTTAPHDFTLPTTVSQVKYYNNISDKTYELSLTRVQQSNTELYVTVFEGQSNIPEDVYKFPLQDEPVSTDLLVIASDIIKIINCSVYDYNTVVDSVNDLLVTPPAILCT
jgi:hypothetical protein